MSWRPSVFYYFYTSLYFDILESNCKPHVTQVSPGKVYSPISKICSESYYSDRSSALKTQQFWRTYGITEVRYACRITQSGGFLALNTVGVFSNDNLLRRNASFCLIFFSRPLWYCLPRYTIKQFAQPYDACVTHLAPAIASVISWITTCDLLCSFAPLVITILTAFMNAHGYCPFHCWILHFASKSVTLCIAHHIFFLFLRHVQIHQ